MSDYFSTVRGGLADAVERRHHLPWYARVRIGRRRALVVVFATLVVAAPALAAVSGWFSVGRPNATSRLSPRNIFGVVKPGGSQLLPISVPDPQGGPPWGLRLVHTNRDNTCLQLGRIENGKLGSLGIDGAWNNDHRFHALSPNAAYADGCGSTDAAGHGYFSQDALSEPASANPTYEGLRGPQASGCKLRGVGGQPSWPYCPPGGNRIVFYGLLGPDATSITYRKPDGTRATERTVGGVGAYLIVFVYNRAGCRAYSDVSYDQVGCNGIRGGGVSPDPLGAVTKITYRDGHSCTISQSLRQRCPTVGWVPFKAKKIAAADVQTPIHLHVYPTGTYPCPDTLHLPDGCQYPNVTGSGKKLPLMPVVPVEWSFTARLSVTTTFSWYSWFLQPPKAPGCDGGQGSHTRSRIRAGQVLRYSTFLDPECRGTYQLTVAYTPQAPHGADNAGPPGVLPGARSDSGIIIGDVKFTIR